MRNCVFLFRKKEDDRDCCAYINKPSFDCGHYFSRIGLHGACYSGGSFPNYNDIETFLLREEYQAIIDYNTFVKELGYGIKENDDRYKAGMNATDKIMIIINKLQSEEAEVFQEKIIKEEKECLKDEYNLNDYDIEQIFNEYSLGYQDRGIVGCVFDSVYDCGYEEAWNLGYVKNDDSIISRFFDFEKFGQSLVDEDEGYLELNDGRVVVLNY